jgi:hypothetical protein
VQRVVAGGPGLGAYRKCHDAINEKSDHSGPLEVRISKDSRPWERK